MLPYLSGPLSGMKGRRWGAPRWAAAGGRGFSEEEDEVQSLSLRELLVHRNPLPLVILALENININGPLERIISLKGLAPWRSRIIRFLGGATPLPDIQVHLPSPPDSIRILHGRRSISEVAFSAFSSAKGRK